MNIELHIDELILEGVPNSQREQVAAAIEQALSKLVSEHGLPPAWEQGGNLATLTQQVQPGSRPEAIGRQVAQAILGNMNGGSQPVQGSGANAAGISAQEGSNR
jgi:hypothetical protein